MTLRAVLLSVTEGEDKPLKYPTIFNSADLAVFTKMDLADVVDFDRQQAEANVHAVAPGLPVCHVSAKSAGALDEWLGRISAVRASEPGVRL